jgi:hypothetical protein
VTVGQAKCHAGKDERGPYRAESNIKDAHRVPVGGTRWHVVNSKSRSLVHCCCKQNKVLPETKLQERKIPAAKVKSFILDSGSGCLTPLCPAS